MPTTRPADPPLPPGQSAAPLRRFGLPRFASVQVRPPARPVVTVGGSVRRPTRFGAAELLALPGRVDQRGDLHCVTTWSALDLSWQGVPFSVVHAFLAARTGLRSSARWVGFIGMDGYRSSMLISDALAHGVLLADTLDGAPLPPHHGAPLRLVAPAHYGYKSVKHVCAIEYGLAYDPGSAGRLAHHRGRVRMEERSAVLPGRLWRPLWRALLPRVRGVYAARDR